MLTDHGAVSADGALDVLIDVVSLLPRHAWTPRTDPESCDTLVIRENDAYFPGRQIRDLVDDVGRRTFGVGFFNRAVLSMVPAQKGILPHTDDFGERVQSKSYHCHIPLVTDPTVVMGGPDGEQHLKRGHLYVMDARCRHWVRNPSAIDRIHLLFAYFPDALASAA